MRELFSRRRERENGELSDVYAYDFMPQVFRNQFCHILREFYRILREIVFETTEVDKIIEHQINNPFASILFFEVFIVILIVKFILKSILTRNTIVRQKR